MCSILVLIDHAEVKENAKIVERMNLIMAACYPKGTGLKNQNAPHLQHLALISP
jgi:hypothetical protein